MVPTASIARAWYSPTQGTDARELAADDVYGGAEELFDRTGIDVRPVLPSKKQIMDMLHKAQPVSSTTPAGEVFVNRYVELGPKIWMSQKPQ